jgi:hypothetical protein
MIKDKWGERVAHIVVKVVAKDGYERNDSSVASKVSNTGIPPRSSVTNVDASYTGPNVEGTSDTYTSQPQDVDEAILVDWATLTIILDVDEDSEANAIADEEQVYEAMRFKAADERAKEATREEIPILAMAIELQREMGEVAIPIDGREPTKPMYDWDRDCPDMSIGTHYPCMYNFRLTVGQHAIVNEFELGIEKSNTTRFRGFYSSVGCPWIIRARTQHDNNVY